MCACVREADRWVDNSQQNESKTNCNYHALEWLFGEGNEGEKKKELKMFAPRRTVAFEKSCVINGAM